MPDRDWWSVLWPDPARVMRRIGVQPEMTLLDLCCGDGYFTAPLAKLVAGRVYALDLDAGMIAQAKAEVAKCGATVLQWICADARDVAAILPELVDYVLLANTFHGVPDQVSLARAVRSVTKPGGSFGLLNWHSQPRERTTVLGQPRGPKTEMRMAPCEVSTIVEPAGFRTRQVVELPPFHYGIVFEAIG